MALLLAALALLAAGAIASVALQRSPRASSAAGAWSAVAASAIGLVPVLRVLLGGTASSLRLPWNVPYGSFFVELDALSAWFLLPMLFLGPLAAVYGSGYLRAHSARKRLGSAWFFFNLLLASMALVFVARNGVLFLAAWELMSVSSFFLVSFDDEEESVRRASWTYLVAMHAGTAFLLALFVLAAGPGRSLDFDQLHRAAGAAPAFAGLLFILGLIGFGTKAGFVPLHVWLPEAHPAAPSHVSAVMSGVMIKTGLYGLLRLLTFLGPPPPWWGWTLVGIGASSGILGVLFALAQHDLKRLLAYHSVENIGIITLGFGLGLLGVSSGSVPLAVFGFAGGLLHVLNHAIFKGLLFLGAGTVLHATGTREIDHLGGLLKRLPVTGTAFLIGSAAISGLPPLNGFVSEFLIYAGAFAGVTGAASAIALPAVAVIGALALIGGLAAACFTKAFGAVFLGEPRVAAGAHGGAGDAARAGGTSAAGAHGGAGPGERGGEPGAAMRVPLIVLAAACIAIGLASPLVVVLLRPVLPVVTGLPGSSVREGLGAATSALTIVSAGSAALLALVLVLALWMRSLLRRNGLSRSLTWDCGFLRPSARMQYTPSSFAQPIVSLFGVLLRTRSRYIPPAGYFPGRSEWDTITPDFSRAYLYAPAFQALGRALSRLRWVQQGRLQVYVLYIAVTLLVLLVWKIR